MVLYNLKRVKNMDKFQFDELLKDIHEMAVEMANNKEKIADTFKKSESEALNDIKKMRKTLMDSVKEITSRSRRANPSISAASSTLVDTIFARSSPSRKIGQRIPLDTVPTILVFCSIV